MIRADNHYMSDIPVSQTAISNALKQLSQLAPSSDIAQKGVEVLTRHLAGNVLSLSKTAGLLPSAVLLKQPEIKGNIQTNQVHQVKLSLNSNTTALPTLDFFSTASKQSNIVISLTDKQLQALLSLPAKQLLASNPLLTSRDTPQLAKLNAIVLAPLPTEAKLPAPPVTAQEKGQFSQQVSVQQLAAQKSTPQLRLSLTEQRPPIEISLPLKSATSFAVGEKVSLVISPKGVNWQVNIMPSNSHNNNQKLEATAANLNNPAKIVGQPILLSPQQASPLLQVSLREQSIGKAVNLDIPLKAVIHQLNKINTSESQALAQRLQNTSADKLAIQLLPEGDAKLLLQTRKPVASILITKELATQLAPLRLPDHQKLQSLVSTSSEAKNFPPSNSLNNLAAHTQAQVVKDQAKLITPQPPQGQAVTPNVGDKTPAQVVKQSNELLKSPLLTSPDPTANNANQSIQNKDKTIDSSLSLKEASAQLLNIIRDTPSSQSVVTPELMNNKQTQAHLLQSLLRIVKAKAEAPAMTLQAIEKALSDPEFYKASAEQSGKQLVEQVLQQIKQALPQGKEQDSSQIRQLLTAPTLNLSALQIVSPAPSQGIMGGLITLLQISLSARLSRNQAGRSEQISKVLNDFLGSSTGNTKAPITPKALSDLSQIEQKHQLMKEIGRLISGHQTSKLNNAEQMLQGQDSFYYNLPSALGGNLKDIELLIKREEQNKEQQDDEQSANKTWQLTMKLSVGELGELLTKAKIRQDNLELNFYASNDEVKNQVLNYLPLLRRKLDSLGIEMSKSHCQLGKIPDTLQQRPYHVFQAKA